MRAQQSSAAARRFGFAPRLPCRPPAGLIAAAPALAAPSWHCRQNSCRRHRRHAPQLGDRTSVGTVSAISLPAAEGIYEATGVPLVDHLMSMRSLDAAAQHSMRLVAIAVVAGVLGTLLFRAVGIVAKGRIAKSGKDFNLVAATMAALFKPGQVLLPYYVATYVVTVGAALAQVAATKMRKEFVSICSDRSDVVLNALKAFTQIVKDTSDTVIIIFVAWAAVDFKNRVLSWIGTAILSDSNQENDAVVYLLRPISGVLNFLIFVAVAAFVLDTYGINIQLLLASVGGISVVVGLASQQLMSNILSSLMLFTARPFNVGDKVHLLFNGLTVVEGVVAQIEPLRTLIHATDGGLVYVNNAAVGNYVIKNMTQGHALKDVSTAEAAEAAVAALVE